MTQQEVLLQHLIDIYTEKGVPLDSLLKSSFFQSLPVEKKLDIIRAVGQNAKKNMGFTKEDTKKILLGLGAGIIGGGLTALVLHNFSTGAKLVREAHLAEGKPFTINSLPIPIPQLGVTTSILGYSGAKLSEVYRDHKDRQALRNMDLSSDNAILQHLIHREN